MRKKIIVLWLCFLMPMACFAEQRCVILLHGLGRSHYAMQPLANYLRAQKYLVINQDYPSTKKSIKALAEEDLPTMIDACKQFHPQQIDFVTHSLGGIVLRQYLQTHKIPKLGRIVMLSPPNHGSEMADLFHNNWLFKKITGPAGQELTTQATSTPNRLPKSLPAQTGVIAGSISFLGKLVIHRPNDGEVSVESAKLQNLTDCIVLPVNHSFMMQNSQVEQQVISFLNSGRFSHQT